MKPIAFLLLLVSISAGFAVEPPHSLISPSGQVKCELTGFPNAPQNALPAFRVQFQGKDLLSGELALAVGGSNVLERVVLQETHARSFDSSYTVPFGKSNPVRDQFNELVLELEPTAGPLRKLQCVFRVYEDGLAFRCLIPAQEGLERLEITAEPMRLRLEGNPQVWPLYCENYTTSHEGLYSPTSYTQLAADRLIDLPLLAEWSDRTSVAITEANLRNYAGLYLRAARETGQRVLRGDLSPLPGQKEIKVRSTPPLATPWRVIMVGSNPGRFIESNLLLNLNEPNAIGDLSWLKVGKATWYWWNGPYQEPVDFQVGLNFATMKHYVDFCARNAIAFHAIMSTTDEHPWYYQTQPGYSPPGPDCDITRPRPGFELEPVLQYARSKGVGVRLWVHWKPLSERLEEAFAQYEKWGIAGLMVDFLDRDDQEMVLFAEQVLQSAARHHLHIHFHGVWKPTGLQRTYPNLLNHEGVLNLEYLKWSDSCAPPHNVTVPFTRLIAGPMDYHLGGFRSVERQDFKPTGTKPSVLGTRCHHLAMYVVYENPMPMVCDAPTAYEGQPGFDFIRTVPTTWDETRVLDGSVGHYIVVARRQGATWYVGAMTDWTARDLELSLAFVPPGQYEVQSWADSPQATDPNQLVVQKRVMTAQDKLKLHVNSGGGAAIVIRAVRR